VGLVATVIMRRTDSTPPWLVCTPLERQPASSAPMLDLCAPLGFKRSNASLLVPRTPALKYTARAVWYAVVPRMPREFATPHGPLRRRGLHVCFTAVPSVPRKFSAPDGSTAPCAAKVRTFAAPPCLACPMRLPRPMAPRPHAPPKTARLLRHRASRAP